MQIQKNNSTCFGDYLYSPLYSRKMVGDMVKWKGLLCSWTTARDVVCVKGMQCSGMTVGDVVVCVKVLLTMAWYDSLGCHMHDRPLMFRDNSWGCGMRERLTTFWDDSWGCGTRERPTMFWDGIRGSGLCEKLTMVWDDDRRLSLYLLIKDSKNLFSTGFVSVSSPSPPFLTPKKFKSLVAVV